eukprot:TRINITY_DN2259_c0_g1_i1.p1 TRINITY_DN2259_c0_g1~~TRINITY_DN2259_c0_g1_i1.p1  ORF type:complete len:396 (-),score=138.82 TRINITY_DN2259_c0_g1_i1:18-1205(-)
MNLLLAVGEHPNVVNYYGSETDNDFYYLAVTRCQTSIEAFWDEKKGLNWNGKTKKLKMMDIIEGLNWLHTLGIVHRDIKPSNILVDSKNRIKVSDMGISKLLPSGITEDTDRHDHGSGTIGWRSKEVLEKNNSHNNNNNNNGGEGKGTIKIGRKSDLFSLGCLMYYIWTEGRHPFGVVEEREANIKVGRTSREFENVRRGKDWTVREGIEIGDLVARIVKEIPEERSSLNEIKTHVFWWNKKKKIEFIKDVSDRLERESSTAAIVVDFENDTKVDILITGNVPNLNGRKSTKSSKKGKGGGGEGNWIGKLGVELKNDLGKFRKYDAGKVRDLLRLFRNKAGHFVQLEESLQEELGKMPGGFWKYWSIRWPNLLIVIWMWCREHCSQDGLLAGYFS